MSCLVVTNWLFDSQCGCFEKIDLILSTDKQEKTLSQSIDPHTENSVSVVFVVCFYFCWKESKQCETKSFSYILVLMELLGSQLKAAARSIYDTYLSDSAPYSVNIDDTAKTEEKDLEQPNPDMFKKAQAQVRGHIRLFY